MELLIIAFIAGGFTLLLSGGPERWHPWRRFYFWLCMTMFISILWFGAGLLWSWMVKGGL